MGLVDCADPSCEDSSTVVLKLNSNSYGVRLESLESLDCARHNQACYSVELKSEGRTVIHY